MFPGSVVASNFSHYSHKAHLAHMPHSPNDLSEDRFKPLGALGGLVVNMETEVGRIR
jgi:hypothetical protein